MTFASTPSDIAQWLILEHGKEILITHDDQLSGSDLHVLDPSGIWKRGDNVLQQWMVDHGNDLREQAVKLTADNYKSALSLMRDARPWFNPKVLPAVRMAAHAAYRVLAGHPAVLPHHRTYGSVYGGSRSHLPAAVTR